MGWGFAFPKAASSLQIAAWNPPVLSSHYSGAIWLRERGYRKERMPPIRHWLIWEHFKRLHQYFALIKDLFRSIITRVKVRGETLEDDHSFTKHLTNWIVNGNSVNCERLTEDWCRSMALKIQSSMDQAEVVLFTALISLSHMAKSFQQGSTWLAMNATGTGRAYGRPFTDIACYDHELFS